MLLLGSVAFLVLWVCPGAWLAFCVPLGEHKFGGRLLLAVALSPGVILAEFYALRFAGVPFGVASWSLVFINAPA